MSAVPTPVPASTRLPAAPRISELPGRGLVWTCSPASRTPPALSEDGAAPVARWRSTSDVPTGPRVARLAQAMPPLLLAEVTEQIGSGHGSSRVVMGLLDQLVDGIARHCLACGPGLLPPTHPPTPRPPPPRRGSEP